MSLFNTMRTSVSGMAAQSNALSAIGDNIANSSTTGYKEANAQFETVIGNSTVGTYESGGVLTDIRYGVAQQGTLETTTSATDLAVNGNGFFVVSDRGSGSGQFLTRAGSFVPDSTGNLVNAAGYRLMGYQLASDGTASSSLSLVNLNTSELQASPSTKGTLTANLPSTATAVTNGNTPYKTGTTGTPSYGAETTVTVYDNLGQADTLDVYFTSTGPDGNGNPTWEVAAYNHADASANGNFPYAQAALGHETLTFDKTTGKLTSASPTALSVNVPNGDSTLKLDLSSTTQFATGFSVSTATIDGSAPNKLSSVAIGTDGTVTASYASGSTAALYRIPLATVQSPDNLTNLNGNLYEVSANSGAILLGMAGTGAVGKIQSDTLEQSTTDLATQLTDMIQAQRGYEANSKVLQTASDMLSNLERLQVN